MILVKVKMIIKDKYYQNIKDYSNEVNDYGSVMN